MEDFWRMIWTEKVSTIVMINMNEERMKCEMYFPSEKNERQFFESFSVTVCSVDDKNDYQVRTINITHEQETRCLEHYWYNNF